MHNTIVTEQEYLEACLYRSYIHSYYGLKPIYPQWLDANKYTKCLEIIKRYKEQNSEKGGNI